ncbi:hypothetical protein GW17_00058461 [Ensete ventricosum]|nr:hypothetical protein GW17_00058461 [Ensete ventricosum]
MQGLPYRAVRPRTGLPADQYADCLLPGGTVEIGHRWSISVIGGRPSVVDCGRKKKREKKERYPFLAVLFPGSSCNPSPVGDSSLGADSFSPHGEKERVCIVRTGRYQVSYRTEINLVCQYGLVWKTLVLGLANVGKYRVAQRSGHRGLAFRGMANPLRERHHEDKGKLQVPRQGGRAEAKELHKTGVDGLLIKITESERLWVDAGVLDQGTK